MRLLVVLTFLALVCGCLGGETKPVWPISSTTSTVRPTTTTGSTTTTIDLAAAASWETTSTTLRPTTTTYRTTTTTVSTTTSTTSGFGHLFDRLAKERFNYTIINGTPVNTIYNGPTTTTTLDPALTPAYQNNYQINEYRGIPNYGGKSGNGSDDLVVICTNLYGKC